jgi:hypothetical protein
MAFAVFATATGYAFTSTVRSLAAYTGAVEVEGVWQRTDFLAYNKAKENTVATAFYEPTLFNLGEDPPLALVFASVVYHGYYQGLKGRFYGVAYLARWINDADPFKVWEIACNQRTLANPTVEAIRFPNVTLYTHYVSDDPNLDYSRQSQEYSFISHVGEYQDKLFITLALWWTDADFTPALFAPEKYDAANMPYFNGGYKFHTAVFDLKTGLHLVTYHDTGIGEWTVDGKTIWGFSSTHASFLGGGSSAGVTWQWSVFECEFNPSDPNQLIKKTPTTPKTRGYSGTFSKLVTFNGNCYDTAQKWASANPHHLMQRHT